MKLFTDKALPLQLFTLTTEDKPKEDKTREEKTREDKTREDKTDTTTAEKNT